MSGYTAPLSSPYDPSIPDYEPETPSLGAVIQQIVDNATLELCVCQPAKIVAINDVQNVNIQPLPQTTYSTTNIPQDRPIIHHVPVWMPRGKNYHIKLPIAVGDTGLALFLDRCIDPLMASDGTATYDPGDVRRHDYNDPVFIPGASTFVNQLTDTTSDLVLHNGEAEMRLLQNGTVQIKNNGQELVDLLNQTLTQLGTFIQNLQTAMVLTPLGPAPFLASAIAQFVQTQTQLSQIQSNLGTLKV